MPPGWDKANFQALLTRSHAVVAHVRGSPLMLRPQALLEQHKSRSALMQPGSAADQAELLTGPETTTSSMRGVPGAALLSIPVEGWLINLKTIG